MPFPFPGMDPYMENAALWPNVHGRLIVALMKSLQRRIANALSPQLLPKYQPIIEKSVQRFIEIRNTVNQEVVTVIEVLSPTSKKGRGRAQYQRNRDRLIESQANLIEVDLLHKGEPMPMIESMADINSRYRVLVSPVELRPQVLLYPFDLPQSLPQVEIPLRADDRAKDLIPTIDFQDLLNQVYEVSGYQFSID